MSRVAARLRHPSASFAIARMEVEVAWADVEDATTADEMTCAFLAWWEARAALREVLIEEGA